MRADIIRATTRRPSPIFSYRDNAIYYAQRMATEHHEIFTVLHFPDADPDEFPEYLVCRGTLGRDHQAWIYSAIVQPQPIVDEENPNVHTFYCPCRCCARAKEEERG